MFDQNTMAGTYPDIFKGAIIYSAGSSANIRNMYPGFTGSYPKIQTYLGSEDRVIGAAAFNGISLVLFHMCSCIPPSISQMALYDLTASLLEQRVHRICLNAGIG